MKQVSSFDSSLEQHRIAGNAETVSKARSIAKNLLAAAELEAEALLAAARDEAETTVARAKIECAKELERLQVRQRVSTLFAWRNAVKIASSDTNAVVERLTKTVLLNELSSAPESILNRINAASEIIENLKEATLEIAESDLRYLEKCFDKNNSDLTLRVNDKLTQGEFVLRTKRAEIKSSPMYHLDTLLLEFNSLAPSRAKRGLSVERNCVKDVLANVKSPM